MPDFTEVGARVWVARYQQYDVNVSVVEGERGLLVVDTHGSPEAGREVIADLRRLSTRPVVEVVNTHAHSDHVLGNAAFKEAYPGVVVTAHEVTARDEDVEADRTFSSVTSIDLGDRVVELVHPGRAHTDGDLVVRVEDADVVLVGDLVEESAPPSYNPDTWPLEWPLSLDLVLDLVGPGTVVVPGHGTPVDRAYVEDQRASIGVVAETVRDLAGRGVPVGEALAAAEWPFPAAGLEHAVRRGYEHLPRSQKRLPLL